MEKSNTYIRILVIDRKREFEKFLARLNPEPGRFIFENLNVFSQLNTYIHNFKPTVILAADNLQGFDPYTLSEYTQSAHIVILTNEKRELNAIKMTQDFAYDYIIKKSAQRLITIANKLLLKDAFIRTLHETDMIKTIVNASPNLAFIKDANGSYIYCNEAVRKFFRLRSSSDVLGKNDFDFYPADQANRFRLNDEEVLKNGIEIINKEEKITTLSGEVRFWRSTKIPLADKSGLIKRLAIIHHDITYKKESEKLLKNSEAMIKAFISGTLAIIYNVRLIDSEPALYWIGDNINILGYSVFEAIQNDWWINIVHPEDRDAVITARKEMFFQARMEKEYRIRHKNGSYVWIRDEAVAIKNENEESVEMVGSWIDITEKINFHETLLENKKQLTNVLSLSQMAYWEYDLETGLILLNEQFFTLFHTTVSEESGFLIHLDEFIKKYVHPNDANYVRTQMTVRKLVEDSGQNASIEHRIIYKDGGPGIVTAKYNFIKKEDGSVIKIFGTTQDITERKRMEDALIKSEEQLSNAMMIARLAHWEYDVLEDRFTFNDQFYSLLKTTAENEGGYFMSGKQYATRFLPIEEIGLVQSEIQKAIEAKDSNFSAYIEHKILLGNGKTGYIAVTYHIVKDEIGRTVKTYGANQDITERKAAEDALQNSKQQLTNALKIANLAYSEFDIATGMINLNEQHFSVYKTTIEKVGSFSISMEKFLDLFIPPEEQSYLQKEFSTLINDVITDYKTVIEHKVIFGDGSIGYMAIHPSIIKDKEGRTIKIFVASQDITKRKMSELALMDSEYFLRKSQAVAQVGSYNYNFETDKWQSSTVLDNIFGITGDYIRNFEGWIKIVHPTSRIEMRNYIRDVIRLRQNRMEKPYQIIKVNDRQERWVLLVGDVEYDEKMNAKNIIGTTQDITERILREREKEELEETLKNRNHTLEQMVINLKQMQGSLVQAEKMASLGQLSAGIAHEINNPLAYISSNINRLNEYFQDTLELTGKLTVLKQELSGNERYLGTIEEIDQLSRNIDYDFIVSDFARMMVSIQDGLNRIKKIIEGMRGFSYLGNSTWAEADINQALDETLTIVWNEIKYKADIEKLYSPLPLVKCNINEIKQVFVNLLVNAAHAFTNRGVITIKTWIKNENINISITDTGCGIPTENIKRIFDPFFTTKPVGQGTGLGLWISSTIIEKNKGLLNVNSQVGKGTTFTVTLPIKEFIKN